ncbi:hypothetical protein FQR65_LT18589 [Abscondita terminalis]|nr:hypothetical protein FQR65_LT18589 [Abscondita terminalis]
MVSIPRIQIDTIIIPKSSDFNSLTEPIPVTPYQIMKSPSLRRWYVYGQNNILFNQAAFSNWNAGGNNNLGINAKVNYSFIYKKGRHFLDNNVQLGYGLVSSQGQSSRKTDDNINIMSNYGYDLKKNYYLSAGVQFLSQFSPGYNYSNTPDPVYSNRISKFMAPGYLNIGIGVSYNPKENFQTPPNAEEPVFERKEKHTILNYKENSSAKKLLPEKVKLSDEQGRMYEFITTTLNQREEVAHLYKLRRKILELVLKKTQSKTSSCITFI